jgi:GAF domain-containing protein
MPPEAEARIESQPHCHGVVHLVFREAKTFRLADLRAHPDSVGMPPNHPPMKSFLGVPIIAHDQLLGILYLTEKRQSAVYTEEDARLVELLAQHDAVAIENTRLYQ